nr:hypothetical protein Iba_chr01aCG3260 [Ipomoea batatas]
MAGRSGGSGFSDLAQPYPPPREFLKSSRTIGDKPPVVEPRKKEAPISHEGVGESYDPTPGQGRENRDLEISNLAKELRDRGGNRPGPEMRTRPADRSSKQRDRGDHYHRPVAHRPQAIPTLTARTIHEVRPRRLIEDLPLRNPALIVGRLPA